jgi:hypothetical protein
MHVYPKTKNFSDDNTTYYLLLTTYYLLLTTYYLLLTTYYLLLTTYYLLLTIHNFSPKHRPYD